MVEEIRNLDCIFDSNKVTNYIFVLLLVYKRDAIVLKLNKFVIAYCIHLTRNCYRIKTIQFYCSRTDETNEK